LLNITFKWLNPNQYSLENARTHAGFCRAKGDEGVKRLTIGNCE
jgi:hypothetical protein